jgi:FAD/FMN-containing dehydrogenase
MTSSSQISSFLACIEGISSTQDGHTLSVKSKDYFWYSPLLAQSLGDKLGEIVVKPSTQEELIRVAAAACQHRINLTVRGGGTGNYGQCVPLEGGVILDITGLNRIVSIQPGQVTCEAGILAVKSC